MKLWEKGAYLVNGKLVESAAGNNPADGTKKTLAYSNTLCYTPIMIVQGKVCPILF